MHIDKNMTKTISFSSAWIILALAITYCIWGIIGNYLSMDSARSWKGDADGWYHRTIIYFIAFTVFFVAWFFLRIFYSPRWNLIVLLVSIALGLLLGINKLHASGRLEIHVIDGSEHVIGIVDVPHPPFIIKEDLGPANDDDQYRTMWNE